MKEGRKKKQIIDETELETLSPPQEPEIPADIEQIMNELGSGDFTAHVYRLDEKSGFLKIRSIPASELSAETLDAIAYEYEGGKFRVKITDEQGRFVKQTTMNYAIPKIKAVPASPANNYETTLNRTIDVLKDELREAKSTSQSVVTEMIKQMGEITKAVMSKPEAPKEKASSLDDIIKLKTLLDGTKPAEQMTSIIDILKKGMELGQQVAGNSADMKPEDVVMNELVKNLMPTLLGKLAAGQGNTPAGVVPARAQEAVNGVVVPEKPVKREVPPVNFKDELEAKIISNLLENKSALLTCAKFNSDINLVANQILTSVPDEELDSLVAFFERSDSLERIMAFIPEFKTYPDYFKSLIQAVLESIEVEPEQMPVSPEPQTPQPS